MHSDALFSDPHVLLCSIRRHITDDRIALNHFHSVNSDLVYYPVKIIKISILHLV